jgi:hypothetical protein
MNRTRKCLFLPVNGKQRRLVFHCDPATIQTFIKQLQFYLIPNLIILTPTNLVASVFLPFILIAMKTGELGETPTPYNHLKMVKVSIIFNGFKLILSIISKWFLLAQDRLEKVDTTDTCNITFHENIDRLLTWCFEGD